MSKYFRFSFFKQDKTNVWLQEQAVFQDKYCRQKGDLNVKKNLSYGVELRFLNIFPPVKRSDNYHLQSLKNTHPHVLEIVSSFPYLELHHQQTK